MMVIEVLLTALRYQSRRPTSCWIDGSIKKHRLTNRRSVTKKHAKPKVKIGIKQQKNRPFDRFFRVLLAVPTGFEPAIVRTVPRERSTLST